MGLEGIISKRADRPYRSGRGEDWVKSKCTQRQELVIAGYLPSTASRKAVGSLVMGVYEAGKLVPVGRVGTGFTAEVAGALYKTLTSMEIKASPFGSKLPAAAGRGVKWVRPELVAEVEFRGWTHDGMVRQGSFQGLREDKDPREVVRETAVQAPPAANPGATILEQAHLTHPDRILWEDRGHHQARARRVLYGDRRLDPASDREPAAVAPALPRRIAEGVLFPETRLGGPR